jgi:hypothetical protein
MNRITIFVASVVLAGLVGCKREPVPITAPKPVVTDEQAIQAATATERQYQNALAKGDLAFLAKCAAGSPEAMRLVEMAPDDAQGYSLAITADTRGAVAIWQGIRRLGPKNYQAYGSQGMRLDGNGWRQLRQLLVESPFAEGGRPVDDSLTLPPRSFLVSCLAGERRMARAPDSPAAFDRIAVRMRRLSGNYYSPPATAESPAP